MPLLCDYTYKLQLFCSSQDEWTGERENMFDTPITVTSFLLLLFADEYSKLSSLLVRHVPILYVSRLCCVHYWLVAVLRRHTWEQTKAMFGNVWQCRLTFNELFTHLFFLFSSIASGSIGIIHQFIPLYAYDSSPFPLALLRCTIDRLIDRAFVEIEIIWNQSVYYQCSLLFTVNQFIGSWSVLYTK